MPTVGKKHFAYTEKGKKAAEAESKRTGKKVKKKKKAAKKSKASTTSEMLSGGSEGEMLSGGSEGEMVEQLKKDLGEYTKGFATGGSVTEIPEGYDVARGSGKARRQLFKVGS